MQTTAGSSKKSERLAKHLGEQIEAACSISPPGSTKAQIGTNVGGIIGAGIGAARASGRETTIKLGRFAWLGLGPTELVITGADNLFGKPKGEPIVRSPYSATRVEVTRAKLTVRVDMETADGQVLAFEVKRPGPANKPSVQVVELLASRCGETSTATVEG